MPPRRNNPFSSFADKNSFLGQPLLPRVGQAISDIGRTAIAAVTPSVNTPPPTLAGVSIPPAGASASSVNPLPLLASLNPFGNRPLIRTDFGERPTTPSQAVPQLPSGATSYGVARTSPAIPVPLPTFPSRASVGASMVTAPTPILPTVAQPTPVPTRQQRVDTAVRYGTISATPQQLENLNARDTAYVSRTPAEQQALIAQMRERGAALAAQRTQTMQNFAQSRIPEAARVNLPAPQGRFGQPLTGLFPQSTEGVANRNERSQSALAATGFGALQRQEGITPSLRGPLAIAEQNPFRLAQSSLYPTGGIAGAIAGGPQPASTGFGTGSLSRQGGFSNTRAEERKRVNALSAQAGLPRALNSQTRQAYSNYFRQQGMI